MRTNINKILRYILLFFCIGLIVKYFIAQKNELLQIANLKSAHIALLILINLITIIVASSKMFFILKKLGLKEIAHLEWLKIFSISRFLNYHVTQGANIYMSMKLKKKYSFTYTKSIGLFIIFSWLEITSILLIAIAVIAVIDRHLSIMNFNALVILGLLLFFNFFMPFFGRALLIRCRSNNKKVLWLLEKLTSIVQHLGETLSDHSLVSKVFLFTVINFFLGVAAINVAFIALGTKIGFSQLTLFSTITFLSGIYRITPGNLGITELLYGYLSKTMGGSFGYGIIASGILRVIGYVAIFLIIVLLRIFSPKEKEKNQ